MNEDEAIVFEYTKVDGVEDNYKFVDEDEIIDSIFIEDTETNIVLITGDVTCNGAKESHFDLIPKLQRLKDAGKKVYLTTGTHDYYMENGNGTGKAEKCVGDEVLTATRTDRDELLEIYKQINSQTNFVSPKSFT